MSQSRLSKYLRPEVLTRLARSDLLPRHLVEGTLSGRHKSPAHGFAVEFAGHREYAPGDDLRHLDWKVYFRHEKHVIKQYEMETNLVCHLMLDVSASMRYGQGDQQKLAFAARMAVTLAHLVIQQSDKAGLTLFDEEVRDAIRPSNSMEQLLLMASALDRIEPIQKTQIGKSLLDFASRAGRRAIVVVLSDFLTDPQDLIKGIQQLRYANHEVVLMQVLHHDELDFSFAGNVRFVGLEMDRQLRTHPKSIRETYLRALDTHNRQLEDICHANRCERVVCDTSKDIGKLFADYLEQRTTMRRRR